MRFASVFAFAALAACAVADEAPAAGEAEVVSTPATVTGIVALPLEALASLTKKGAGVRILVNGEHRSYAKSAGGGWSLQLPPGVHIVEFAAEGFVLPQLRVDVSKKTPGKFKAMLNDRMRSPLGEPVVVQPVMEAHYFEVSEGFNWMGIFKNPMVLMMIVALGMTFLAPQADSEEMKEAKEQMFSMVKGPAQQNKPKLVREPRRTLITAAK